MNIIQQPDALSLSLNLKDFIIASDKQVSLVLYQGSSSILSQRYDPPTGGNITISLRDVIHGRLATIFKDSSLPYEQTLLTSAFTAIIDGTEVKFDVVRGGIDRPAESPASFLVQNFLTWQPNVKPVTYYSPEFLTYYAVTKVIVKLRAYFTADSGKATDSEDIDIVSIPIGKAYTIPLQYSVVAGLLNNRLPAYYDVWVENTVGNRLSYIQRYYADDLKTIDEDWILFENSLGGIDTFRADGSLKLDAEHTHNIAEIDEESIEYRVDTSRKYTKNTGYLNREQSRWLLDFFPSVQKYIYTGSYIRPIVVIDSDVASKLRIAPSSYTFTYKFADARPLLNLPRTNLPADVLNITVPDVGSFTVPPRLAEFPRLSLSEGALIPVQNPYSEKWGTTTAGAIATFIGQLLSALAGSGGGIGHSHNNIDLLNLLGDAQKYLLLGGKKIKAGYADKAGSVDGMDETFLHKRQQDTAHEIITFLKGLLIGENGSGITVLENGMSQAVVDYLYVKVKAIFDELDVKKKTYVGGEQVISHAGMTCIKVEDLPDVYRCYMKAEEDGIEIENQFTVGSLAIAQECNIKTGVSQHAGNRYYWRAVTAVGTDYIDLSKTVCDPNVENDIPVAGDDIVGLGHLTDITRQGAIILSSVNEVSPSILMYQGINDFTLSGKETIGLDFDKSTGRARLRVYGDAYIGAKDRSSYIEYGKDGLEVRAKRILLGSGDTLDSRLDEIQGDVDLVKEQADKEYTLWFFNYDPTLANIPASDWTSEELRALHEQDMFYNRSTGHAWRFEQNGDGGYSWNNITDQQTVKALENAAKAQDTADGKCRVFVAQPTKEQVYDVGDQWVNASYGDLYNNDTLVCKTAKAAGAAFSIDHWKPSSGVTTAYIKNLGESIELVAKKFNPDGSLVNTSGLLTTAQGSTLYASKSLENGDNIIGYINQTATTTMIAASKINITGSVSFNSFDNELKNTINGKVDASSLGSLAKLNAVEKAQLGSTLISGGYLKAELIDVDNLYVKHISGGTGDFTGTVNAKKGVLGGFSISGTGLINTGFDNDAYVIFRNDPHKCFAGIGGNILPASTGVRGVARFENHDETDWWGIGANYAMLVSAQGGDENCAIGINGGYISGMAVKVQVVTSEATIKRDTTLVICTNSENVKLYMPEMKKYDDGHVLIVRGAGGGSTRLITGYGYQRDGTRVRNCFSSTPLLELNVNNGTVFRFVYSRDTYIDGQSFRGVWNIL